MLQKAGMQLRWRWLPVLACVLLGIVAVRNAAVSAYFLEQPHLAHRIWADHPAVSIQLAMVEVGKAAAASRTPSNAVLRTVKQAAASSPLAIEPLLVESAMQLGRGQAANGERLLAEVLRRDPRNLAARHLLADLYARQGRPAEALEQIAAIGQRLPAAHASLAPAVARFFLQPGSTAAVRSVLSRNDDLREKVLVELARDAVNTDLVLSLSGRTGRGGTSPRPWQSQLVASLISAGEYRRALEVWEQFHGAQPRSGGLFNPQFTATAPAPFNWRLAQEAEGVAEATGSGGVRLTSFGRTDVVLASQMILLSPGQWQLAYRVTGEQGESDRFQSVVRCLPGGEQVFRKALRHGEQQQRFKIPETDCKAQFLELKATSSGLARTVEVELSRLALSRVDS